MSTASAPYACKSLVAALIDSARRYAGGPGVLARG